MSTKTNKPVKTLRDGNMKAAIWRNESEKGVFFSTTFTRGYKVDDQWKEADSYSGSDLLRLANLAQLAHAAELELRDAEKSDEKGGAP